MRFVRAKCYGELLHRIRLEGRKHLAKREFGIPDIVNEAIPKLGESCDETSAFLVEEIKLGQEGNLSLHLVAQLQTANYVRQIRFFEMKQQEVRARGLEQRVELDYERPIVLV